MFTFSTKKDLLKDFSESTFQFKHKSFILKTFYLPTGKKKKKILTSKYK